MYKILCNLQSFPQYRTLHNRNLFKINQSKALLHNKHNQNNINFKHYHNFNKITKIVNFCLFFSKFYFFN